jgi:predicted XRE-type DNA-binding protein
MKTKKSTGNVFADLGFHGEEAENLRIRALLMAEAEQFIKRKGLSQAQAAARMGVSQPRISDLVRGKIGVISAVIRPRRDRADRDARPSVGLGRRSICRSRT